jgi:hypothetical protein
VDDRAHGRRIGGIVVPMTDTPFRPLLRTQSDVEQMWRRLMNPLGFASESLWLVVIEGERPEPRILEIVELGEPPDVDEVDTYAGFLEPLVGPDTRFALLRSRPGGGRPNATDRAWARALYDAGRRAGARLEMIHLAHDQDICPLALDDLLAEPA